MNDHLNAPLSRLAEHRSRPCLLIACDPIDRWSVVQFRDLLAKSGCSRDAVDLVVLSPGGDPNAAYILVREIHRNFKKVAAFVPFYAKSAATLICLSAHELVLGPLGELGPLDVQVAETRPGDFAQQRSSLERSKALEQLQRHSLDTFNLVVQIVLQNQMRPLDACNIAAELTARLMTPLYAQVDPLRIGQSARNLEIGAEYANRILTRYRRDIYQKSGGTILEHLVTRYPSHDFVIDAEELSEMGVPYRLPDDIEAPIMAELENAFVKQKPESGISLITPVEQDSPAVSAGTSSGNGACVKGDEAVQPAARREIVEQ